MGEVAVTEELYKKHRPKTFKQVIGQDDAVRQLANWGRRKEVPHFLLFSGPSGVGKTTIARILRERLGCGDADYREVNAADSRGIDMVRGIRSNLMLAPISGRCRFWTIDECFPAGTLVSTEEGLRPIEQIGHGDYVFTVAGKSWVENVFQNAVSLDRIVRLHFDDGTSLVTTKQHEFLTEEGWVRAENLDIGLCILGEDTRGIPFGRRIPHEQSRKDVRDLWEAFSKPGEAENVLSAMQIGDRGRWEWPSLEKSYIARQKEDPTARRVRVAGVEVYERGRSDSSFLGVVRDSERRSGFVTFYDLQIAGHPSYFVEGLPVHNCHQLTSEAQNSFLKMLEDTPEHVYFVLTTTDPQKLLRTIVTRATELKFRLLSGKELERVVSSVLEAEGSDPLSGDVMDRLVDVAEGSARKALVLLHAIIGLDDEDERLSAISKADHKVQAIELARLLLKPGVSWLEVAKVLKSVDEEHESLRRMVLGYCRSVLLGGGKDVRRAAAVIDRFQDAVYESGAAGLALACYDIVCPMSGK